MSDFSISDLYDQLILNVQSFPMDSYYYKRQSDRIECNIKKFEDKLLRMIKKLPKCNIKKLNRIEKKLNRMFRLKKELLDEFSRQINLHREYYEKLCSIVGIEFMPKKLLNTGDTKLVVRVSEEAKDAKTTYCICNDIANGGMILCDNISCKINWFHMKCVGLSSTPKEGWLCHLCSHKN